MNKEVLGFAYFINHCQYNQLYLLRQLIQGYKDKGTAFIDKHTFKRGT